MYHSIEANRRSVTRMQATGLLLTELQANPIKYGKDAVQCQARQMGMDYVECKRHMKLAELDQSTVDQLLDAGLPSRSILYLASLPEENRRAPIVAFLKGKQ